MKAQGYHRRLADFALSELIADHPLTLVVGPRACGKTTTASRVANSKVHLAVGSERAGFEADIEGALRRSAKPMLIDEWQESPQTLGYLKTLVDTDGTRGQFVITGSVRGDVDEVTWPLTGRSVRLQMYGLTEREIVGSLDSKSWFQRILDGERPVVSTDERVSDYIGRALRGGFPDAVFADNDRAALRWLTSYVDQLVTRDAQSVEGGRDPLRLRRYLTAYALNSAGTVDDSKLYGAAGIAKNTARSYDRLLQNLLVIEDVPAWTTNRLKRLSLAPKRFLVDSGLFAGVLAVTADGLFRDGDLLGRVLETFVMAQLRAECALLLPQPRIHHLRTQEGRHEIDIVIETGPRTVVALEVKATAAPTPDDLRHLRWLKSEMGDDLEAAILLHGGSATTVYEDGVMSTPIAALWS